MAVTPVPPMTDTPPFPSLADRAAGTYNSKAYAFGTHMADTFNAELIAVAESAEANAADAAASAATAETKAQEAADSATAAGLAAGNATDAASDAVSASNAAVAALDAFTDIFLGAKAANPTVDNDGNPLQTGALYWNTTSSEMRVYSGSAWVTAYLPASGYATLSSNTFTGPQNEAKGANVASAGTVNLDSATGNLVHITGATAITAITLASGAERDVVFDGVLTLTNGASLLLPGAANITTAAGDRASFRGDGSGVVRCMHYTRANGTALVAASAVLPYLHVRDEKGSGTNGGGPASVGTNGRTLNTVVTNTITGASLASDVITLPAGTYRISAKAPAVSSGSHKAWLFNSSDSTIAVVGTSERNGTSSGSSSVITGSLTIASTKNFRIQHYYSAASGTGLDFGGASGSGSVEVYTQVEIWKEA